MKRTIIYIIALAICASLVSCVDDGLKEKEFIAGSSDISLTVEGKNIFTYSPAAHQLGFNDVKNEFRVNNDSFSHYFVLTCASMPSQAGENIQATIVYTNLRNNVVSYEGVFKVSKINDDNGRTIWMWNQDKQIGAVVKVLQ
ncbi:MAG: hypothetical protein NC115_03125 [Bacteroidales bacterium]|nr:hypothetical protein [Bacteroides sp.]MCM1198063.1 hypothetical protein [Clostridium sp.]MCM1501647.1 hypothetical protein [Bacteroidales bacterium]